MANSWYLEGPPRLHVRRLGAGDSHVVMVHGIVTGSLASWLLTSAPKVAKEHAVTLFDMRGHGLSERPPSGYRISDMLDDLDRVTQGIDRFALVGHSYGAWVSARAAERWPDRVTALFAVDPPLGSVVRDLDPEEVRPSTLRRHGRTLAETTLLADIRSETRYGPAEPKAIPCRSKFVFGRQSPYVAGAAIVEDALGADAVAILDGGHSLHVDARAEVTDMICEFLRTSASPGR